MHNVEKKFLKLLENTLWDFSEDFPFEIQSICEYYVQELSTRYSGSKMLMMSPYTFIMEETELIELKLENSIIIVHFKSLESDTIQTGTSIIDYVDFI